ncbi:HNH endonuclease [Trichocoleus sp. FACHB-262]|uniref:HNH endonuclease n=1 Tax=Trichocoleus sp. FACHB-262 TaxID=2692869 RepID=UPI001683AA42|nr:hypothetical protein [Trichocoleus sp. FACHB-262]MBD2124374.1 hypothetical protein [Trichocoleus sp. FACHB-262]
MAISNQTRRILWKRSGDRCAVCQRRLVVHATESYLESAIGNECHIVAPEPNGPRSNFPLTVEEPDDYSNLILLCQVHHQLVDDQPHTYPVDKLREIKRRHEAWIRDAFNLELPASEPIQSPLLLYRMETGLQLISLLRGSHASRFHHDHLDSDRTELANEFLQNIQERLDSWDAIASQDRITAQLTLNRAICNLEANGLLVYAARQQERHQVENLVIDDWQVGYLLVVNQANPIAANRSEALERLMGFKLATDREFASYILIQLQHEQIR